MNKTEMVEEWMIFRKIKASNDFQVGSLRLAAFESYGPVFCCCGSASGKGGHEIQMPEGTTEFSISKCVQSIFLFLMNQFSNAFIFNAGKFVLGNGAGFCIGTSLF